MLIINSSLLKNTLQQVNLDYFRSVRAGGPNQRVLILSINDKIVYYSSLDNLFKSYDDKYFPAAIDSNDSDFINMVTNTINNILKLKYIENQNSQLANIKVTIGNANISQDYSSIDEVGVGFSFFRFPKTELMQQLENIISTTTPILETQPTFTNTIDTNAFQIED